MVTAYSVRAGKPVHGGNDPSGYQRTMALGEGSTEKEDGAEQQLPLRRKDI